MSMIVVEAQSFVPDRIVLGAPCAVPAGDCIAVAGACVSSTVTLTGETAGAAAYSIVRGSEKLLETLYIVVKRAAERICRTVCCKFRHYCQRVKSAVPQVRLCFLRL